MKVKIPRNANVEKKVYVKKLQQKVTRKNSDIKKCTLQNCVEKKNVIHSLEHFMVKDIIEYKIDFILE